MSSLLSQILKACSCISIHTLHKFVYMYDTSVMRIQSLDARSNVRSSHGKETDTLTLQQYYYSLIYTTMATCTLWFSYTFQYNLVFPLFWCGDSLVVMQ